MVHSHCSLCTYNHAKRLQSLWTTVCEWIAYQHSHYFHPEYRYIHIKLIHISSVLCRKHCKKLRKVRVMKYCDTGCIHCRHTWKYFFYLLPRNFLCWGYFTVPTINVSAIWKQTDHDDVFSSVKKDIHGGIFSLLSESIIISRSCVLTIPSTKGSDNSCSQVLATTHPTPSNQLMWSIVSLAVWMEQKHGWECS